MNFSDSTNKLVWKINLNDSTTNSSLTPFVFPLVNFIDNPDLENTPNTTGNPSASMKPCIDLASSQSPAVARLPGSLDALFYIIIVLMFYAFSIVVLMVKYVRREREEANLRNYYHEFVSRDKFQTAQFRNKQFMKKKFSKGSQNEENVHCQDVKEESCAVGTASHNNNEKQNDTRNSNRFSRLLGNHHETNGGKESFTFLGVKNGLFGKKFYNKHVCSKCVSESVPTIDWDDERVGGVGCDKREDHAVGARLSHSERRHPHDVSVYQKNNQRNYLLERDNSTFFPILECESDADSDNDCKQKNNITKWNAENAPFRVKYNATPQMTTIVSSCSLDISNMLAALPPLNTGSPSIDMDTLDGLSNFDSEAGSQSLLNYSASIKGTNSVYGCHGKDSPGVINKSGSGDDRLKDLGDFLSERTSLLSCTLSIDDPDDDDATTNHSSAKHHSHGISLQSSSNGKRKGVLTSNAKSFLNSLSKSLSSDEGDRKKFLTDITNLTEDSGVFKNLKYFLRGFSKDCGVKEAYETLNLLPRETYFGSGSPQSLFGNNTNIVPPSCGESEHVVQSSVCAEADVVHSTLSNPNDCDNCSSGQGSRWGYAYDTEDEVYSEGDRSSSFGDYFMGETSASQAIDLSKPLVRRELDSDTKDVLSRAFLGIDSVQTNVSQEQTTAVLLPDTGCARRETKV